MVKKIILTVIVIVGLFLIGIHIKNEYYDTYVLNQMYKVDNIINKSEKELKEEGIKPLEFVSMDDIKNGRSDPIVPATRANYEKYREDMKRLAHKGRLFIPSVEIDVNIYEGLHNAVLLKGAGEQLPRSKQKMGESGNYILASHMMKQHNLLFNRLRDVNINDLIFVTNEDTIFVYKTDIVKGVEVYENEWLNEKTSNKLITLYTCLDTWLDQPKRTVVRGHLIDQMYIFNIKHEYDYIKGYFN